MSPSNSQRIQDAEHLTHAIRHAVEGRIPGRITLAVAHQIKGHDAVGLSQHFAHALHGGG